MGWKHYQTLDHPKREPQVGSPNFGIRLLILHFKFQFTKSLKSSTLPISLNLTYPLRKNISFQKCPKITHKFTQRRLTVVNVMSIEILRSLKRDRDIWQKGLKPRQNSLHVYPRLKAYRTGYQTIPRLVLKNSGLPKFLDF